MLESGMAFCETRVSCVNLLILSLFLLKTKLFAMRLNVRFLRVKVPFLLHCLST